MATPSGSILGATPTTLPAGTGNSALDAYTQASLTALAGGVDYTQSPTYQSLQALLGPGQGGGLNASLMGQYNAAQPLIQQQVGQAAALAESGAQGRGLGGSSIAAQGIENATQQGTLADASLLGSLYGEQNQNTEALASDLFAGSTNTENQLQEIFGNAGSSAAEIAMYQQALQDALQEASAANTASLEGAGIGAAGSILGGAARGAFA